MKHEAFVGVSHHQGLARTSVRAEEPATWTEVVVVVVAAVVAAAAAAVASAAAAAAATAVPGTK